MGLKKTFSFFGAIQCLCLNYAEAAPSNDHPDEFLTENEVNDLKAHFEELNLTDSLKIGLALSHLGEGKSTIEHFYGYVGLISNLY